MPVTDKTKDVNCYITVVSDIGGATPKFLGGPNLRPTTDIIQLWDLGERYRLPSGVRGGAPENLKFGAT